MPAIVVRSLPLIRRTFFVCLIWIGFFFLLELKVVSYDNVWVPNVTSFENQSRPFNVTITNNTIKIVFANGTTRVAWNNAPATTNRSNSSSTTKITSPITILSTTVAKITSPTTITSTTTTSRPTTTQGTTPTTTNRPVTTSTTTRSPTTVVTNITTTGKPECLIQPNFTSPTTFVINQTTIPLEILDQQFPHIQLGGHWEPEHCVPSQKIGIMIPFRDRWHQLPVLLRHLHPLLVKQLRHYTFYVIEQADTAPFNRGKLLNAGVTEALKIEPDLDCFILHDVDTLPETDLTMYKCTQTPQRALQMATYQKKRFYAEAYTGYTGGVLAIRREHFEMINGFSNEFWGWGAEDDELARRLERKGIQVDKDKTRGGYFFSLEHKQGSENPNGKTILKKHEESQYHIFHEGLNSTTYQLLEMKKHKLFTLFKVNTTDGAFPWLSPIEIQIRKILDDLDKAKKEKLTLPSIVSVGNKNKK